MTPTIVSSIATLFESSSSLIRATDDLEAGAKGIEMVSRRDFAQELNDEISIVRNKIAPHVDRYQKALGNGTTPDAISIHASNCSVAMTELTNIIHSHSHHPSSNDGMDESTFLKAEEAIDTLRHTHLKLHQRAVSFPKLPFEDMGLASVYQKGQSYLLSVSPTNHADALLWQFTNRHQDRKGPGSSNITHGASRKLWPPTARTMRQTRLYLLPTKTWSGKEEVEFESCKHTLNAVKEMHRDWAIDELITGGDGMNDWEKSLITSAVEKSGGIPPALSAPTEGITTADTLEEGVFAIGSDSEDEVVAGPSTLPRTNEPCPSGH